MKALVGAFNQEKALAGAFSVIVQLQRLIDLRHYMRHELVPSTGPTWLMVVVVSRLERREGRVGGGLASSGPGWLVMVRPGLGNTL